MVERLNTRLLLTPGDFAPTDERFEVIGVFNPGAVRVGEDVFLLVRVAQGVKEKEKGWLHSPRSRMKDGHIEYTIDRLRIAPGGELDYRKPLLTNGRRRLAFISHLELIRVDPDGYRVRAIERSEALFGNTFYEEFGVEDPRITQIGDTCYISYVAVSEPFGVCTSLMTTRDFETFERHGPIFSCENKDVVFFPEQIDDHYWCFHRPVGHIDIRRTAILAASSPDMQCWGRHHFVLGCRDEPGWYSGRIGAGPPPIRTDGGWLSIFHGVQYTEGDAIGRYTAGAMLTALDEPWRVIGISREPFFVARTAFEMEGYVKDVIFPTGIVRDLEDEDVVHVYYGCADSCVAVASFSVSAIIDTLADR